MAAADADPGGITELALADVGALEPMLGAKVADAASVADGTPELGGSVVRSSDPHALAMSAKAVSKAGACRATRLRAMTRAMKTTLGTIMVGGLLLSGCDAPVQPKPEPTPSAAKSTTSSKPGATQTAKPTATPEPAKPAKGPFPESQDPLMKEPSKATEKAPDLFRIKFETTAGDFEIECTRAWAPNGVDRVYSLAKIGYFDDVAFFRAVQKPKPFVVQFGIHGNPEISKIWQDSKVAVDEYKGDNKPESNKRGMVTFAMAGSPDTRTTQLFINYADNANLDAMNFSPVCKVVDDGMTVVEKIHSGYGERITSQQGQIVSQGNTFLRQKYSELDYIKTARLVAKDD